MKSPIILRTLLVLFFISTSSGLKPAMAQDHNMLFVPEEIEHRLKYQDFEVYQISGTRWEEDLTRRLLLLWPDSVIMHVKFKKAPAGGTGDNNEPRYQIAAYKLQKLFLDPQDYVVPPAVGVAFSPGQYQQIEDGIAATFRRSSSIYVLLSYWLHEVSPDNIYDKKRFEQDPVYARHLANMNILAYLIDHKDSNTGNFLISTEPGNPRVFVVDNDLAFDSRESHGGAYWRRMRIDRVPATTVARLKRIDKAALEKNLGVVEQYEIRDGCLFPAEPTANLDRRNGVRQNDGIVQLGLTDAEISKVHKRLANLLKLIDSGEIDTF